MKKSLLTALVLALILSSCTLLLSSCIGMYKDLLFGDGLSIFGSDQNGTPPDNENELETFYSMGFAYTPNPDGKTCTITGVVTSTETTVFVPVMINEYTVTAIGEHAFGGYKKLKSITIPDGVTSIGDWAFSRCTGLTSINIPNSVTSIGSSAFFDCSSLTSVHINDIAAWCGISFGDYAANPLCCAKNLYLGDTLITDLVIPSGITSISDYAFSRCTGLTSITIPDSVTSIGNCTFASCSGLTSVTIPDSVTSIGEEAFFLCTGLTSVTVGNGVTSIGDYAFYDCFELTTINFEGKKAQWNAITKGTAWKENTGEYTVYCTDGKIYKADS